MLKSSQQINEMSADVTYRFQPYNHKQMNTSGSLEGRKCIQQTVKHDQQLNCATN